MSQYRVRWAGFASLLCAAVSAVFPNPVSAEVPLTRAYIESLENTVELLPQTGSTRPVHTADWLTLDETVRTADAARADLRFNDGSLARIGEQVTFQVIPNTRTFRLFDGTALLLIPPGRGASTIETPNAITQFQETALVVRHVPAERVSRGTNRLHASQGGNELPGRTVVMVLTDHPEGPVEVSLLDGKATELTAGQMAIVDGQELFVFEFDLALFYETSALVEGLHLDDPNYLGDGRPTDPVRQETLEGLANQRSFEGEYLLDPEFLRSEAALVKPEDDWLLPLSSGDATSESDHESKSPLEAALPLSGSVSPEALIDNQADLAPDEIDNIAEDAATVNSDFLPPLVNDPVAEEIINPTESAVDAPGGPSETPVPPPAVSPPDLPIDPVEPVIGEQPVSPPGTPVPPSEPVMGETVTSPEPIGGGGPEVFPEPIIGEPTVPAEPSPPQEPLTGDSPAIPEPAVGDSPQTGEST